MCVRMNCRQIVMKFKGIKTYNYTFIIVAWKYSRQSGQYKFLVFVSERRAPKRNVFYKPHVPLDVVECTVFVLSVLAICTVAAHARLLSLVKLSSVSRILTIKINLNPSTSSFVDVKCDIKKITFSLAV